MTRKRSPLSELQRSLYLASRTVGDVNAAKRGRYVQRRVRRYERRTVISWLRRIGL